MNFKYEDFKAKSERGYEMNLDNLPPRKMSIKEIRDCETLSMREKEFLIQKIRNVY